MSHTATGKSAGTTGPALIGQAARSHRLLVAIVGVALAAGTVAVSPTPAEAAERATSRTVWTLPFIGYGDENGKGDGGGGTVKMNAAVSNSCNAGDPIVAPQWYFVGEKTKGSLRVGVDAYYNDDFVSSWASGTAIVDHWSRKVLACSTEEYTQVFPRSTRPVDVVAYLAYPAVDMDPEWGRIDPELHILIDRIASTPPANDQLKKAKTITTLPYRDTVDTSRADADGPDLIRHNCDWADTPKQASTVWYKYKPAKTGAAPNVVVKATTNWTGANYAAGEASLRSTFLEVLTGGGTRVVANPDPTRCDEVPTLKAGVTYLIGVYFGWDDYNANAVAVGGPISVSLSSR